MKNFASLVVFCACLALTLPSHAETTVNLNAGVGSILFQPTTPDGTWYQQGLPHSFYNLSLGYKLGAHVTINNWLIGGNYIDLGASNVRALATTSDQNYDTHSHVCLRTCDRLNTFEVTTRARGFEGYTGYKWDYPLSPFVTVGLAQFNQRTTAVVTAHGKSEPFVTMTLDGQFYAVRLGAGLCYKWICADTTYYKGISGQDGAKFPVAQDALLTTVGISIPLF